MKKIRALSFLGGLCFIISIASTAHSNEIISFDDNENQNTKACLNSPPVDPESSDNSQISQTLNYVEDEVIVKFKKGRNQRDLLQTESVYYASRSKKFNVLSKNTGREYVLITSPVFSTKELLITLKNNPGVKSVSPNFKRYIVQQGFRTIANDSSFDELWGIDDADNTDIDAPEAWTIETGSHSVVIAVIDTGVDYNHSDLAGNMWENPLEIPADGKDNDGNGYVDDIHGIDARNGDPDPMDDHGHGTHVAGGIIGAVGNNGKGVTGVNWQVSLLALEFLDAQGVGTDADAIECIEYLIDLKKNHDVNIVAINASWAGSGYNPILKEAVREAGDNGILFCAAAGNNGNNNDLSALYPASHRLDNIISVAATNTKNLRASFSNFGPHSVDLGAPGVAILSASPRIYNNLDRTIFFDSMEYGSDNWIADASWNITTEKYSSKTHAWSDSPGCPYKRGVDASFLLAEPLDLTEYKGENICVEFKAWEDLDGSRAFVEIEVSGDNGQTWHIIGRINEWKNEWEQYFLSIPEYCKTDQFKLKFHLIVDEDAVYVWDGVYIDAIRYRTRDGG